MGRSLYKDANFSLQGTPKCDTKTWTFCIHYYLELIGENFEAFT